MGTVALSSIPGNWGRLSLHRTHKSPSARSPAIINRPSERALRKRIYEFRDQTRVGRPSCPPPGEPSWANLHRWRSAKGSTPADLRTRSPTAGSWPAEEEDVHQLQGVELARTAEVRRALTGENDGNLAQLATLQEDVINNKLDSPNMARATARPRAVDPPAETKRIWH